MFIKNPPGSLEAIAKGCTCLEIDNHYGRGLPSKKYGQVDYIIADNCPLHSKDIQPGAKKLTDYPKKDFEELVLTNG